MTAEALETYLSARPVAPAPARLLHGQPDGPRFEEVWFDGVDDMLAEARARLQRVGPRTAYQSVLWRHGVLVDIRPEAQRRAQGTVDPRLNPYVVERIDLEWRFDPRSAARVAEASYDLEVVVLDAEGTTSSLAAESLQRLGLHRATDVVGGFAAWRAQGMPSVAAPDAPLG